MSTTHNIDIQDNPKTSLQTQYLLTANTENKNTSINIPTNQTTQTLPKPTQWVLEIAGVGIDVDSAMSNTIEDTVALTASYATALNC